MNFNDAGAQSLTVTQSDPSIIVTSADGKARSVVGLAGNSLMQVIRDSGIDDLPAYCGGVCSCASCHIQVAPEWLHLLPAMSEDEAGLLESIDNRTPRSRLSCQIPFSPALNGLPVTTAHVE